MEQMHAPPWCRSSRRASAGFLFLPLPFHVDWNALFIFVGTFTGLVYFFFSLEHKKAVGGDGADRHPLPHGHLRRLASATR